MLLLLLACGHKQLPDSDDTPVQVIVDAARPDHYFDLPFPSDDLLDAQGVPQLDGFPVAPQPLAAGIVGGWATRIGMTVHGFANNGPAYFRFGGVPGFVQPAAGAEFGAFTLDGVPTDPVVLVAMDGSEILPLTLRFVSDPHGDPFYGENTLALAPKIGHTMKSATRYAAVILDEGVAAPDGYTLPDGVNEALQAAGITRAPVAATVFTTQDSVGEMQALFADADTKIPDLGWDAVRWKHVIAMEFAQGQTPSGEDATIFTATYEDGSTAITYLGPTDDPADGVNTLDLSTWPVAVYEADLPLPNYSRLNDRPYMSPGLATLNDTDRYTGWIDFDGFPGEPHPVNPPDTESVRIVLTLPRGDGDALQPDDPLVIWDHGTSGQAYHVVQRPNNNDDGLGLATIQQQAGVAMLGHDAPLYGTRYPLIDEGYGDTLGFYNIVNLPAFRDNQRQTAVDGHMIRKFAEESLNGTLTASGIAGSIDTSQVRRGGHSLGSVTSNIGVAAEPDAWQGLFLYGSGGLFTHFFLDTGMLSDLDPTLIESLFGLVGQPVPDVVTPATALGAIVGLDEEAWGQIDRLHPVVGLFQWTMDPSDPMSLARYETLPSWMIICTGDHQVPNFTSEALAEELPDVTVRVVDPTSDDYDPHQCMHRELEGQAVWQDWLGSF